MSILVRNAELGRPPLELTVSDDPGGPGDSAPSIFLILSDDTTHTSLEVSIDTLEDAEQFLDDVASAVRGFRQRMADAAARQPQDSDIDA